MIKLLSSEWLRAKRTAVQGLTLYMPIIFSLCVVAYLTIKSGSTQEFAFEGFFTIWTVFIIPIGVGILAGFIVQEEELAGNFNGFLCVGISRVRLYLGKFLFLLFCLTICTFIATLILCIGMNIAVPSGATIWLFLSAAGLVVIGTLPLLAIHLWVSFAWGMGASIGISIGGILMAAILGLTSVGAKVWAFVPWTWPVKLGMLPGTYFIKEAGTISTEVFYSKMMQSATVVFIVVAIGLIIFLIGGVIWFKIWEGRKSYE
ncbi:lantibiotic immunity ABC transporter MutG family permease subunit [Clostridioides difficile]|uniref:ABC transporter lantibiotic/multidrug-family permease n=2 Tax=Clostridioides difficile TaxID=1496 RepID=A0AAX3H4B1_CLODI|nr:lantibiotic immunity ABC transporter MutG family permease subunit [Clostridioides difficile]AVD36212.1 lantibiotic immunity ABC transporter MutG family permease subunit [Clostridioides difficile]AVD40338.1 lantibiotic immunity ABC transporter MutG family permease subunit [Clostridioides difficile]AVD43850.1 lantibiotic immunity ABC transporter MutG family permease subunit [Clostridioides difficile]AXU66882.1 lantibiotic ABC transporter permease [Clostridioides difficile]AXU89095.1 lantibiot